MNGCVNRKTICIIGSGASGLTCIKNCRDRNLDVVCFEKSNFLGGLWKYRDDDVDGLASVTYSTIINSSKEMSAYSDFPPPIDYPNYMHNTFMHRYFELYAEKFDLEKYIKYEHEVTAVDQSNDYDDTGRWQVTVLNKNTGKVSKQIFDGVLVCTGHHVKPIIPTFPGQDKFKGKIIHTHSYKRPNGFENKNVCVVGIGNSGGDAAVELSMVAKQTYLSTRRGAWIMYRVGPFGTPFDSTFIRRFVFLLFKILPFAVSCFFFELLVNFRFDHKKYGLKPKHRLLGQHPMVNDALPNRVLSGTVMVKGDIQEFTENGVIFKGDHKETPMDAVVLATGYEVYFPFLDQDLVWTKDNEFELYKYMFVPRLKHAHTLCIIGLVQAFGPAIPISEIQVRWFCELMLGKCRPLPSYEKMIEDIRQKRRLNAERYFEGPRNTMQIDWIPFMDEISSQFGANPKVWKYFFTDPRLWWALVFGPALPYHYRLDGPGKWSEARENILTVHGRVNGALQTRYAP